MPDSKGKGGNPLTKEAGGLKIWQWGLAGGGALLLYLWWKNRQASAALGTTASPPAMGTGTGTSTTPGSNPITSLAQWIQEAVSGATSGSYNGTQAYNDISGWLSGNCVSQQGAVAIGNALTTLGLPPGFNIPPTISVCPTATPPAHAPTPTPIGVGPGPLPGAPMSAAQQALHARYIQALQDYQAAVRGHATGAELQQLMADVTGAQAAYQGQAGTPTARAAYDQALAAYREASRSHASQAVLAQLFQQVIYTQARYLGHG